MAAGVIIGRVAVKVIPDTSDFQKDLERDLNALERNLKPVEIDITVDTDGVVREAKKARDDAQKAMKDLTLKVNLADENSVKQALSNLDRELVRLGEKEIKVGLDADSIQAAIDDLNDVLTEIATISLQVDEADPESVRNAVKKIEQELAKLRATTKIEVEVDEASLREVRDALIENLDKAYADVRKKVQDELDSINIAPGLDAGAVRDVLRKIDVLVEQIESKKLLLKPEMAQQERLKVEREIEDLERKKIILRTEIDADSLREARDLMNLQFQELRRTVQTQLDSIVVHPHIDTAAAEAAIRKLDVMLEQIERKKIELEMDLDDESRRNVEREIEDLQRKVQDIKVELDPRLNTASMTALSARLALLARDRYVEYVPRVNKAAAAAVGSALARMAGARIIGGYMKDLYNSIIQFDKAVPKIIALSTAVGGLGIVGLTASSNLFALSASLASIAPAALALPGIFGGAAVGIGVMIAALKDFNKVFPDVKKTLADMQDSISTNFWAGAMKSMRQMINTILPALGKGFDDVATRLGKFSAKLTSALTQTLTPALPGMFANLSKSIDIASEAADNIVGIITTLGEVGASYLPSLAQWFVDITTQFDNFLKRSTESGEIFQWIDAGVEALQDLARVGGNAALILYDIAQAAQAAGGSSLGALADGLARIREITQSPGFQNGLTDVFRAAHDAMGNIVSISGPAVKRLFEELGQLATDVLPVIGATIGDVIKGIATALSSPAVTNGIRAMFDGIMAGVQALDGIWEPLGRALGTLGPLVGDLARNLGEVLGAAIPPVADALVRMGDALAPLIPVMGDLLLDAVEALTPVINNLADAFVNIMENGGLQFLTDTMTLLGDAITAIPTNALTIIVAGIIALGVAAGLANIAVTALNFSLGLLGVAVGIITAPITAVILVVGSLIAVGYLLITHWDDLQKWASSVWKNIKVVVTTLLGQAVQFIIEKMSEAATWMKKKWDEIKTGTQEKLASVVQTVTGKFSELAATAKSKLQGLKDDAIAKWESIRADTSAKWESIKSDVSTKISNIKSDISNKLSDIRSDASAKWESVKSDARAKWESIKSDVSTKVQSMKTDIQSKLSELKSIASSKWGEFKSAALEKMNDAVADVRGLPSKIRGALGSLGSLLSGAGSDVIDGFIAGLRAGFARVQSTLSSLTSLLPDWKGPRDRDKTLLTEAGELVIGGFIKGLESQYDAVKNSLRGLTEDMSSVFGEPITAEMQTAMPKANVRNGLVGSVRTAVTESASVANGKTLIYHAAPGSSLGSEEDLFAAADRGRMVGW